MQGEQGEGADTRVRRKGVSVGCVFLVVLPSGVCLVSAHLDRVSLVCFFRGKTSKQATVIDGWLGWDRG